MPAVAKNLTLGKRRRDPELIAKRDPELDSPCPLCLANRGTEVKMFHYVGTDSMGKSFRVNFCSWHQSEIPK